ncbi:hypothetical protein K8I61_18135 [bacterium]|nr:hypothetical protein [bacterium]
MKKRTSENIPTRQMVFDYDRTVVAFHGTRKRVAEKLVDGAPFGPSENDDDWLGHGIYFWEYAPQQAWAWAEDRFGKTEAAVVGSLIRLGRCLDLLDPGNAVILKATHDKLASVLNASGKRLLQNANKHKFRDCAVFNYLFQKLEDEGLAIESTRAVFVPLKSGGKLPRVWPRSGVFQNAHIQLSVRAPANILAVWPVRRDGRYGKDKKKRSASPEPTGAKGRLVARANAGGDTSWDGRGRHRNPQESRHPRQKWQRDQDLQGLGFEAFTNSQRRRSRTLKRHLPLSIA